MKQVEESNKNVKRGKKDVFLIVLIVLCVLLAILIIFEFCFENKYMSVEISGSSMEHTLSDGDVVYADRKAIAQRGDIVVIDVSHYRERDGFEDDFIIKRVIGLEGDYLRYSDGALFVRYAGETEFKPIEEDYAIGTAKYNFEHQVGQGEVFFMGDNRDVSKDSSSSKVGIYHVADIVGVVPEWAINSRIHIKRWESFKSIFKWK